MRQNEGKKSIFIRNFVLEIEFETHMRDVADLYQRIKKRADFKKNEKKNFDGINQSNFYNGNDLVVVDD